VRYYTTKPMNGGTTFTCTYCQHNVTTLDFDSANGNRRTQAAAVINQHAASLHLRTSVPTKLGSRVALGNPHTQPFVHSSSGATDIYLSAGARGRQVPASAFPFRVSKNA